LLWDPGKSKRGERAFFRNGSNVQNRRVKGGRKPRLKEQGRREEGRKSRNRGRPGKLGRKTTVSERPGRRICVGEAS